MAVNYECLFRDLGKFLKSIDQFRDVATGLNSPRPHLPDLLTGIESQLINITPPNVVIGRYDILEGVNATFRVFRDTMASWGDTLGLKISERITHRDTILNELLSASSSSDIQHVLFEMFRDMVQNSQRIKESVVGVTTPTPLVGNDGNGIVVVTKVLDGVNQPSPGFAASLNYKGLFSEISVPEVMSVTCIQDEDSDNLDQGQELFLLEGEPSATQTFDWRSEGSGVSISVPTLNTYDFVANRDFEIFEPGNIPNGFEIILGTPGTNIIQETTAIHVHRGFSALKLVGNGTNIDIRQHMGIRTLTPCRLFLLSAAIKGSATIDGTLTIKLTSDSNGYTAGSGETISLNAAALQALSGGYALLNSYCYIMTPASMPDDLELTIQLTGGTTGTVWVDSVAFGPVVYGNGIGVGIIAGNNQFVRDDRFQMTVSNTEGIFQRMFRRLYKRQMPSGSAPSTGLDDSLAT